MNICVCLQGAVNCVFRPLLYTPPLLKPSQLIKHCGSFPSASWVFTLFCILFVFVLERVFFGSGQFCLQSSDKFEGVVNRDIWCICVCVCTYKFCVTSFLRSNTNKSNLLKSKVAKLSLTDVCFSTQCRVS